MIIDDQIMYKTTVKKLLCDDDNDGGDDDGGDDGNNDSKSGFSEIDCYNSLGNESEPNEMLSENGSTLHASMADNGRANQSLCDLSYHIARELMKSLDTDKGWEALAAEAGYTFDRIQLLALKQQQADGSPTRTLLWELGCQGYKVKNLYKKLNNARRVREVQILQAYLNEAEQESKGYPKKLNSSLFVSLPELLNKSRIQGLQEAKSFSEAGLSSPVSELNFNHSNSFVERTKSQEGRLKQYDDKVIPGTEKINFATNPIKPISSQINSDASSLPACTGSSYVARKDPHHKTVQMPPSTLNHVNNMSAANVSISSGSDNLKRMLTISSDSNSMPSVPTPQNEADMVMSVKTVFSYENLKLATDGFSEHNILGKGAFGTVYFGALRHGDTAIKRLHVTTTDTPVKLNEVKSELAVLLKYQHENIVTLYGYAKDGPELCVVYQYLKNGSLEDRLFCKDGTLPLGWERRLNILFGACKGLHFLHKIGDKPLIHGDIKSANILLDQYYEAKIGDFGQAGYATSHSDDNASMYTHITKAESSTKQFFTKAYQAPEVLSSGHISLSIKSDVYALGVVILEVCSGLQAHSQDRSIPFLTDIFSDIVEKPEEEWSCEFQDRRLFNVQENSFINVLNLAHRCLNNAKKKRPDCEKLMTELKKIHKDYAEMIGEDMNSLSTSLQLFQVTERPSYQSQKSDPLSGEVLTSSASMPCGLSQQLQEQRLIHFSSLKSEGSQSKSQSNQFCQAVNNSGTDQIMESKDRNKMHNLLQQNEVLGNIPGEKPDTPLRNFSGDGPVPEALLLQIAYDKQPEKKKIDRLSGLIQKDEVSLTEYPSDPKKLQELELDGTTTLSQSTGEDQSFYSFPKCDPKKLSQLMGEYVEPCTATIDAPTKFETEPEKLSNLENLDDRSNSNCKLLFQKLCSLNSNYKLPGETGQSSLVSANQSHLTFSPNSSSNSRSIATPGYSFYLPNSEQEDLLNHRRHSSDSNIHDGLGHDDTETARVTTQCKEHESESQSSITSQPSVDGRKKMELWLQQYEAMKNNQDVFDGEGEEEEGSNEWLSTEAAYGSQEKE